VIPAYFPAVRYGGPIRSVHGLSSALVARGHEVHVFTTTVDGSGIVDVPLGQPVEIDGVEVTYFSVPALRRLYWSPAMGRRLRQSVASFDVVHLQSIYLWPTWAAARAAARARVPYVMSPRGMLVGDLIRRKNRLLKTAWIWLIERQSLTQAAAVHVTTEMEADELRALGLALPDVFCLPNGVSWPDPHLPLSAGPFSGVRTPYALYLGRINWKKGLDRLIAAWKWVPNLNLIIAGNDEENYRPRLERLVRTQSVSDRVQFLGAVSDEHKWGLYESAELFVLPSYSENFGNVVAEAMAMSCPVVVTPEVGLASMVRETGSGVVASGEPRLLANAISALVADPARRRQLGIAGRQTVLNRFSWNTIAEQMEAVYLRLANRAPAMIETRQP
jgi:glycosyltransferase involved in cell wall biosynthesis